MICILCNTKFNTPPQCPKCSWNADNVLASRTVARLGDVISTRYSLSELLGSGRLGITYKARDYDLNSNVSLKFIHSGLLPSDKLQRRFVENMKHLLADKCDNTCNFLDVGIFNDYAYVASEFADGFSLAHLMKSRILAAKPFSINEIYPIFFQIVSALINSSGETHGAICPGSIWLEDNKVKLQDCGLVENLPIEAVCYRLGVESTNRHYVAPEVLNDYEIGISSDVYSLGVILDEMLTLRMFNDKNDFDQVDSEISEELDWLVKAALAVNINQRYKNVELFIHALREFVSEPKEEIIEYSDINNAPQWVDDIGEGQDEPTLQIAMKDVISKHYEEIVKEELEISEIRSLKEITQKVRVSDVQVQELSNSSEVKSNKSIPLPKPRKQIVHPDKSLEGIDPRLLRAAAAPSPSGVFSDKHQEKSLKKLDDVEPRFLRAAATLQKGEDVKVDDFVSQDDDWRSRIEKETAGKDAVVSFIAPAPVISGGVQGFAGRADVIKKDSISSPPAPRKK